MIFFGDKLFFVGAPFLNNSAKLGGSTLSGIRLNSSFDKLLNIGSIPL